MNSPGDVEREIVQVLENDEFRQKLRTSADPKALLERQIGVALPPTLRVEIHQGQPDALAAAEQCQVIDGRGYTVYICRDNGVITVLQIYYGPFPYI